MPCVQCTAKSSQAPLPANSASIPACAVTARPTRTKLPSCSQQPCPGCAFCAAGRLCPCGTLEQETAPGHPSACPVVDFSWTLRPFLGQLLCCSCFAACRRGRSVTNAIAHTRPQTADTRTNRFVCFPPPAYACGRPRPRPRHRAQPLCTSHFAAPTLSLQTSLHACPLPACPGRLPLRPQLPTLAARPPGGCPELRLRTLMCRASPPQPGRLQGAAPALPGNTLKL